MKSTNCTLQPRFSHKNNDSHNSQIVIPGETKLLLIYIKRINFDTNLNIPTGIISTLE